jgi:RND family efflux transporter MFP subunit
VFPALVLRANERRDDLLVEGFTEPYRTVEVAAPDTGIVDQIHVTEGTTIQAGQLLASLDKELHEAQLSIASVGANAKGKLEWAQAELWLRNERLAKLEQLDSQGFAHRDELERARADVRLGEADLLSAMEERQLRKLELERAKVQLERRNIRSRLNGVVTKIHKEAGEFVAANDPVIVTVAQLNPLKLNLSVKRNYAVGGIQEGRTVRIWFVETRVDTEAQVEQLSPLTDAESNTVTVRLRIDNPDGRFRAGDRCVLDLRTVVPELANMPASTESTKGLRQPKYSVGPPRSN